ncbi:hypothetical protein RMSM_00143 [Rhodopirellula maiorica SM1]|uniref:Uncharacterized protein n=1 Tax=Rhodopirellula maiorica SM1 TaxID=1265738 RepID=M5S9T4_9BACT|nr:hypothetical protein [Rhodopirellula maiorica]EMI22939.1 hypothetical protein RMSM_00143 [Rhodopirellula maiorica SM1]
MNHRTNIQARDAWFASLANDPDSVRETDANDQACESEFVILTTDVNLSSSRKCAKPNHTAKPVATRGLRQRLSRFGV